MMHDIRDEDLFEIHPLHFAYRCIALNELSQPMSTECIGGDCCKLPITHDLNTVVDILERIQSIHSQLHSLPAIQEVITIAEGHHLSAVDESDAVGNSFHVDGIVRRKKN